MEGGWTIWHLIIGMAVTGVGFVIVWKADWMLRNFGVVPFAEKFLSTEGGTRLFYKLIGIIIMIGGMMHATNLLSPLMSWTVRKMFGSYLGGGEG